MPVPSDWERVAADPALLTALRRRYPGSGDPLDHLWWTEHPGEPTPEGVEDPRAVLDRSRRDLYRPGAGPQDADRLAAAHEAITADREAAARALRSVDAVQLRAAPPAADRPRLRGLLAGLVLTALAVGAAGGFAAGRFVHQPAPALKVFDRAQRGSDRPPPSAPLPSAVLRSSLREVGSAATSGSVVYGARTGDGRVCAVVVIAAVDYVATCSSPSAFADSGLTVAYQAIVDPTTDSERITRQRITLTWTPDGPVRF